MVVLYALTACGDTDKNNNNDNDASGGTGDTHGPGTGGTTTQGQGGTTTQGQGGTTTQGQGGTTTQGQGGTTTQGQGGTAGDASNTGTGGLAGSAGSGADGGSAGATAACADQCEPCAEGNILAECDPTCICEPAHSPDKPVHEELAACDLDEPCPPSVRYDDPGAATWQDGICMLTAFRDRTLGKYHHASTAADVGDYTTDYTFLLGGDDQVLMLRTTTNALGPDVVRTYFPVWSCTLKSYELLDDCVEAGTEVSPTTTSGPSAICDVTQDWFETCETAVNPVCPGQ